MAFHIIKSGTWVYDGLVERPVDIIALDYDFHFEDEFHEPGEEPQPLSADGFLYYVRFRYAGWPDNAEWADSIGFPTVDEAIRDAEAKVPGSITWAERAPPTHLARATSAHMGDVAEWVSTSPPSWSR